MRAMYGHVGVQLINEIIYTVLRLRVLPIFDHTAALSDAVHIPVIHSNFSGLHKHPHLGLISEPPKRVPTTTLQQMMHFGGGWAASKLHQKRSKDR